MKESVKIAIISVIATLAIASLIFAVLLKTGVIEINSQRARDTEKTVISDNNQSEITEGELEDGVLVLGNEEDLIAIQNKESGYEQITCIKEYDFEDRQVFQSKHLTHSNGTGRLHSVQRSAEQHSCNEPN